MTKGRLIRTRWNTSCPINGERNFHFFQAGKSQRHSRNMEPVQSFLLIAMQYFNHVVNCTCHQIHQVRKPCSRSTQVWGATHQQDTSVSTSQWRFSSHLLRMVGNIGFYGRKSQIRDEKASIRIIFHFCFLSPFAPRVQSRLKRWLIFHQYQDWLSEGKDSFGFGLIVRWNGEGKGRHSTKEKRCDWAL